MQKIKICERKVQQMISCLTPRPLSASDTVSAKGKGANLKKEESHFLLYPSRGGEWEGEAGLLVPYAGGEATYYYSLLLLAAIRVRLKK